MLLVPGEFCVVIIWTTVVSLSAWKGLAPGPTVLLGLQDSLGGTCDVLRAV
jgi:hypothetical protein